MPKNRKRGNNFTHSEQFERNFYFVFALGKILRQKTRNNVALSLPNVRIDLTMTLRHCPGSKF